MTGPMMRIFNGSETHEAILKDSIDHFIAEFRRGKTDFSSFRTVFFRIIQTMEDPPLEFIWFYSAVTFHSSRLTLHESSKQVLILKDLFHLLVSCSEPCNGLQKVTVLAPILYVLYSCFKRDLSLRGEIEGLVEGIISYISLCCANYLEEEEDLLGNHMMVSFLDLIRLWTMDQLGKSCELGDATRLFFPLLSDQVRYRVGVGCGMRFLSGIVMVEFFLLRLCLRVSRKEGQGEVKILMTQTVKGFQNSCFHDTLLRVMLEPTLPVTTLLNSEEEIYVRKVLYDAVLLGEFPFWKSCKSTRLSGNHLKNLALVWLLVADKVIQFAREYGEHSAAILYMDAFSKSDFSNLLLQWVTNQTGMEEKLGRPNTCTPKALIKWLLLVEDQGIRVFDDEDVSILYKVAICKSRVDYALPTSTPAGKNFNGPTSFFDHGNVVIGEDNKVCGDQEMIHSLHNPFAVASFPTNPTTTRGRRKREEINDVATPTKIFKQNNFHENSVKDILCHGGDSGNTVHDDGDEDMEDM